uniref:Nephrocystin 3-like N-terminal domain-containing protein n=1 Tax=Bionectria ochroleuca TaxID=29856 RepID=A0A8H7KAE8_BIOOC
MPLTQAAESHQQLTEDIPGGMDDNVTNNKRSPFPNDAYQVGWISALPIELAAARGMLDEEHGNPQTLPHKRDNNNYVLGQIHNHKVVIACLPRGEVGTSSAALGAQNMMHSFPNIRIGLMVGIGAGIPKCSSNENDDSDDDDEEDVHLGDVVISSDKKTGGVVAYNFGKKLADGSFEVAYHLDQPPRVLRTTLSTFEATHEVRDNLIPKYIDQMLVKLPGKMQSKWVHPGLEKDILFPPDYMHSSGKTCESCDQERALRKALDRREDDTPVIHYGVIATGSQVVRHAPTRDQIRSDHSAICLEMGAAGLMNNFPCLVIRGISNYADSHKNDRWHRYAAATAAACAKELLSVAQPLEVGENPRAAELVRLLDKIDSKLGNVDVKIDTFITASQEEKLRKWLSASNPEINFKAALGTYHPGTCLWFLESDRFKNWKLASRQSLWMHGIPGSGKTVMSSKIIDNLLSEGTSVLYFFFDTRDSGKQTLDDLLRSLILQLYTRGQSRNVLESLFVGKFGEGNKRLFSKDLETTFLSMVNSSGGKFKIVLDAMDECTTKADVLDWVQSSDSKSEFAEVGFLVTSRNGKVIESGFKKWLHQDCRVPLETEAINKDITGYIEFCLQSGRYFERWSNHPRVLLKMKQGLIQRADGMFRLAVCQLEILKSCIDIGQVEDEIKRLPRTLEGVYERILRDIKEHHHTRVVRILQFLVYSQRRLRIDELVDAIAVDLSREPEFEPERRMPDAQGILEMCPSLLVSRELNAEDDSQGNKTGIVIEVVELAHATVKEYLISLGRGSKFYSIADPVRAQGVITTVCLAYLSRIDEKEAREKTRAQYPLAQFSSRYWLQHAKGSDELLEVREATIRFLSDERTRHIWGSLYNPDFPTTDIQGPYKMATPLYYASLAGLAHTVTKLLQIGADPMNADGGEYGNSLQAACAAGQEEVVKILLLERDVDVNRAAGSLGSALQAASTQKNEKVINMLLEKGAKLQANGGKYGTALQAASARGNHGVVRLLLDKGADPNLLGGKYNNALYIACLRGYEQIVRFLLDHGADSNAESPERGIPLQAAAEGNHTSIIQMLLDKGALINKKSGLYGCTLQLACVRGSEQVARLLLDKGADPNQAGGIFGNPLQAASARGDASLVRLLLEKGADPNAWGGYYKTSIQAASANGYVKVMKLLIDRGVDVNAHDRADEYAHGPNRDLDDDVRREPTNAPVAKEDTQREERHWVEKLATMETKELQEEGLLVKQLLVDEPKPKQKPEEDPNQVLRYKSRENPWERSEQILLRRLKKNRLRDSVHSNALQAASAQGWTEAVALLLKAGADTNTCEGIYGNPLQASSAQGQAQIAKLLIDNGTNPNKLGGFHGIAMQAASARGHDQVVAVLLDN